MQISRIGLDLAKYVFQVHGVDAQDEIVLRKTLRRDGVAQFFAELEPCIVGMEACCGSHYWARVLTDLGHEVRLISPQFVKPYVKSNKNDRNDAEAICEAVGRPSMRFVPPKSPEQLEIQAVHRIRQRVVASRTRLVNQVRGLLGEHGVVVARDITRIRRALGEIADSNDSGFGDIFIDMLRDMRDELGELDIRLAGYNRRIKNLFRSNEMCQRIGRIEGVGPSKTFQASRVAPHPAITPCSDLAIAPNQDQKRSDSTSCIFFPNRKGRNRCGPAALPRSADPACSRQTGKKWMVSPAARIW